MTHLPLPTWRPLCAAAFLCSATALVSQQPFDSDLLEPTRSTAPAPRFTLNGGQWPADLAARAAVGAGAAWFHDRGVTLHLGQRAADQPANAGTVGGPAWRSAGYATVQLTFGGGARELSPHGEGRQGPPTRWVQRGTQGTLETLTAQNRETLRYPAVWPGIDAVFRGRDGQVAYDFELQPGVAASAVEILCEGLSEPLRVADDGSLVMDTELGTVRQTAPRSFELAADGTRIAVTSRFELHGPAGYGFVVERLDTDRALLIDPGIDWSTFFGGAALTSSLLDVKQLGASTFAATGSTDETLPAPWNTAAPSGPYNLITTLLDTTAGAAGAVWTTVVDGAGFELVLDIDTDPATGVTTVVGVTDSADFPVTANALQSSLSGIRDGFLVQFDASGAVLYSTYIGGIGDDRVNDVVMHRGLVTLVGSTASTDLPMAGTPWQATKSLGFDAFIYQLDLSQAPANQLQRSTFIGSTSNEGGIFNTNSFFKNFDQKSVRVAANGDVVVVINPTSRNISTTAGAFNATGTGGVDVWVGRFDPQLAALRYATYFGATSYDLPMCMDLAADGVITVGMVTGSSTLPTTAGAFDTLHAPGNDGFLLRIDPRQTGTAQLAYGSYFGGSDVDEIYGIDVEPSSGIITFGGQTRQAGFGQPGTPGAFQTTPQNQTNGYVARLDPAGGGSSDLHYASYLSHTTPVPSGAPGAIVWNLAQAAPGRFLIVGETSSPQFPIGAGGPQPGYGGGTTNSWALLMDLLPGGVTAIGRATPACAALGTMQVNSQPAPGNTGFQLLCENAPASAAGVMLLGLPQPGGARLLGVELYATPLAAVGVNSTASGAGRFALPAPPSATAPFGVAAQFVWLAPSTCAGTPLRASNALTF